jgi:serine/threonine-protein kinase
MTGSGGQTVVGGRFELAHELGAGGAGVVYSARDRTDGCDVAIRLAADCGSARASFFHESLHHEHLIAVRQAGPSYVVMELVEGGSLSSCCTPETRLPVATVLSVMLRVAAVLEYLHERGVSHGDVKPGNILYSSPRNVVKLADIAYEPSHRTPAYAAPERLRNGAPSPMADQFSFGVTLYRLLCGELPFATTSLPRLLWSIAHDKQTDPRMHRRDLTASLVSAMDRMLEKRPADRFKDMREVAAALQL